VLITVPVPVPASVTVNAKFVVLSVNIAVTAVAAAIVITHVPVPWHGAPQPVNVEPAVGAEVKVICVPLANGAAHVAPQLIPAGALVTVPVPVPSGVTVKLKLVVAPLKVAVTVCAVLIVTVHEGGLVGGLASAQLLLKEVKVASAFGVAVSVTCSSWVKFDEQVSGQLIAAGSLVTVPPPVTATVSVSFTCAVPWHSTLAIPEPASVPTMASTRQAEAT
jgi:hypothetical protein